MLLDAINNNLNLKRYKVLFISGNYSRILSRLNRNITELDFRRAFTVFQLMTILEENHHSFLIVEHDPSLYEDAAEMVEYIAQHLRQTSRVATVLLYAPTLDSHLEKMTQLADRVFCFYEVAESTSKRQNESRADVRVAGHPGGILMRIPWNLNGSVLPRPDVRQLHSPPVGRSLQASTNRMAFAGGCI